MDILALIADLQRQGFQLTPRGDKLAVSPASKLTPELTELLKAYNRGQITGYYDVIAMSK